MANATTNTIAKANDRRESRNGQIDRECPVTEELPAEGRDNFDEKPNQTALHPFSPAGSIAWNLWHHSHRWSVLKPGGLRHDCQELDSRPM